MISDCQLKHARSLLGRTTELLKDIVEFREEIEAAHAEKFENDEDSEEAIDSATECDNLNEIVANMRYAVSDLHEIVTSYKDN